MPGAGRTRSLVCKNEKQTSVVTTGTPKSLRHSLRDGFTAYFVISPVSRAFLPPSLADHHPQTWHQHRGARTTRLDRTPWAHSPAAPKRPSHPALHVRDDREASLLRARDGTVRSCFL